MKRLFILLLTFFTTINSTFSQKRQLDSVKTLIKDDKEDTIKVAHLNYLASLYSKQKKYNNAERNLLTSLELAEKIGSLNAIKSVHFDLAELYKASNKTTNELEHYKKYISTRDSILNEVNRAKTLLELEAKKEEKVESEKTQSLSFGSIAISTIFFLISMILLIRLLKANRLNRQLTILQGSNEELAKKKTESETLLSQQKQIIEEQKKLLEEQKFLRISNEELHKNIKDLESLSLQQKYLIEKQKLQIEKYSPIINIEEELSKNENELNNILSEYKTNLVKHEALQKEVTLLQESLENIDYGLYKPHYTFKASSEFKIELEKISDALKDMIKNDKATICNVEWTVGESKAEGKKMIKQMSKLMLRAFNGESDSAIAKVSWSNVVTMEARITRAHETIDKFGDTMKISISDIYKDLKLKELYLNFELEEKQYKEKEEQRKIKEQMRDEEKARREMDREMKEAQEEEMRYEKALVKAKQDIDSAKGKELDELNEKIKALEDKLQHAHEDKQRAVSRAQLTKSGYIYVISNIGSFGEHVYKIGMTRRLDPQDRIDELGDASVPFDFDVHGLIYSDNAPELEAHLHNRFELKRVNLVNYRTEFFKVTIDEIESVVNEMNLKVQLTKMAVAKEYRETISLVQTNNPVVVNL